MTRTAPGVVFVLALAGIFSASAYPQEEEKPAVPYMEIGKVKLIRAEKRVEVPGVVAVRRNLIELFACGEGGKVHESVLRLDVRPSNLNLALKLLELDDGGRKKVTRTVEVEEDGKTVTKTVEVMEENGPNFLGDPTRPQGDPLIVTVRWEENGETRRVRAEDMIFERRRGRSMPRAGWIYTGSRFVQNPRTGREEFIADHSKTIMTTWHDPDALIDNPLPDGGNDEVYFANPDVVPERGTPVTLEIRVPTEEEKQQALAVEKKEIEAAEKRKEESGGEEQR